MTKREQKTLETLSVSILTNQLALHYNEQLKYLGCSYYKHKLKNYLNLTVKELIKAEKFEFDKIEAAGETISTQQSTNLQTSIEYLVNYGLVDFMFLNKVNMASNIDRKKLEDFVDDMLKEAKDNL